MSNVDGKLAYLKQTANTEKILVIGDQEFGHNSYVNNYAANGKVVAYHNRGGISAGDIDKAKSESRDLQKISGDEDFISSGPFFLGGKIYYTAGKTSKDGKRKQKTYFVYDNVKYGDQYQFVGCDPILIGGKFTYQASMQNLGATENFIVSGDQEFGKEYDNVNCPYEINGKLTYKAFQAGKEKIIIEDIS